MVGQDAIIHTLKNALKYNKISHAYMFSGPRGIGKTSVAKILAKTVNCLNLTDGEACNECENCHAAMDRECVDIIEIDAASNNGVDEIRELKNKINLVPSKLKYKVYIIDEVHMLSIGAFNALLKTLEEPPKHVIFILATTDPHKVPITILSRCQCFSFRRISEKSIVERLKQVSQFESIEIEDDVLQEIARYSDGGMRDALGMLDKLSSCIDHKIILDDFQSLNGLISKKELKEFIDHMFANESKVILNFLVKYSEEGKDFIQFVNQLIQYLRDVLVNYYLANENLAYAPDLYVDLIHLLTQVVIEMKNTENARILFEISILKFMNEHFTSVEKTQIISREIILEEEKVVEVPKQEETVIDSDKKETVENEITPVSNFDYLVNVIFPIRINNTFAEASKEQLMYLKNHWSKLSDFTFDQEIGYLVCILLDGNLRAASEKNLIISYEYESMVEKGLEHIEKLQSVLLDKLGCDYHLVLITNDDWLKIRQEFIERKNQHLEYSYQEEPALPKFEEQDQIEFEKKDTTDVFESAVALFGDVVVEK